MWIARLRRIFDLIRAYFYNANTEFVKDIWITDVVRIFSLNLPVISFPNTRLKGSVIPFFTCSKFGSCIHI